MRLPLLMLVSMPVLAGCGPGDVSAPRGEASVPFGGADTGEPGDDDTPGNSDSPPDPPVTDDDAPQPAIVPLVDGGYGSLDPAYRRLQGPGLFTIDTLWEINLGRGIAGMAAQRFRAPASGPVASVKQYFWGSPGYSAGIGGTVSLRIFPDDGSSTHAPDMSGEPIATGQFVAVMRDGSFTDSDQAFAVVPLTSRADLVAGRVYHVVYSNAVDSADDYISLDLAASNLPKHGRANRWLDPTDWAVLRRSSQTGNAWQDVTTNDHYSGRAYFTPILQVTMANGIVFGASPVETGAATNYVVPVSATAPIRERFSLSRTCMVTGLSVHAAAEVAGSLGWELKHGDDVVASGELSQASANYATDETIQAGREQGNVVWYDVPLDAPVAMNASATYDLVFTARGNSRWRLINQRNGRAYGYTWGAGSLYESYAQHFRDGAWLNTYYWDLSQNGLPGDSNWPVVLHCQ